MTELNDRIPQGRVYLRGFRAGDFASLRPGTVLVEPVRAVARSGEIHLASSSVDVPGISAAIYRVLRAPSVQRPEDVQIADGDIVCLRNAALEPIHKDQNQLVIGAQHIHGVVADVCVD